MKQQNAEVLGISTDSVYAHKVFKETSPSTGAVQYPLVSDRSHRISKAYRVLDENTGAAYRATVIVNPSGVIVLKSVYPKEIGRNSYELLRVIQALNYEAKTKLGTPANWVPGNSGIVSDTENIGKV